MRAMLPMQDELGVERYARGCLSARVTRNLVLCMISFPILGSVRVISMIAPTVRLASRYNPITARYAAVFSPFQQQVASFTTGMDSRRISAPSSILGTNSISSVAAVNPLSSQVGAVRNAGTSVLGCAIAVVAVGGCAQGIGQLFAALVVGIARNPSMKEDLFTYTLIGMGFLEFLALGVILISFLLLYSE